MIDYWGKAAATTHRGGPFSLTRATGEMPSAGTWRELGVGCVHGQFGEALAGQLVQQAQALEREPVEQGDKPEGEVIDVVRRDEFSLLDAAGDDRGEVIAPRAQQCFHELADLGTVWRPGPSLHPENPDRVGRGNRQVVANEPVKLTPRAVLGYYLDYVCPVPRARDVLLRPAGWAEPTIGELHKTIGLSPSVTAEAPTVFPSRDYLRLSRNYYQFKSQDEVNAWNALFVPITQGS
jgi:hypothetical protein